MRQLSRPDDYVASVGWDPPILGIILIFLFGWDREPIHALIPVSDPVAFLGLNIHAARQKAVRVKMLVMRLAAIRVINPRLSDVTLDNSRRLIDMTKVLVKPLGDDLTQSLHWSVAKDVIVLRHPIEHVSV